MTPAPKVWKIMKKKWDRGVNKGEDVKWYQCPYQP